MKIRLRCDFVLIGSESNIKRIEDKLIGISNEEKEIVAFKIQEYEEESK